MITLSQSLQRILVLETRLWARPARIFGIFACLLEEGEGVVGELLWQFIQISGWRAVRRRREREKRSGISREVMDTTLLSPRIQKWKATEEPSYENLFDVLWIYLLLNHLLALCVCVCVCWGPVGLLSPPSMVPWGQQNMLPTVWGSRANNYLEWFYVIKWIRGQIWL